MKTLLSLIICLSITATASVSHAYHDDETKITDGTAYTLGENEWRIGLWKLEYGTPIEDLQIGTWTLYWAPWIVGAQLINVNAKYELWSGERTSIALGAGLFYLDLEELVDTPVEISVVPFDVYAARRMTDSITLGARLIVTAMNVDGAYDRDELGALRGAAAASSAQIALNGIWRLSRVVAFEAEWRAGRYLEVHGQGKATVEIDEQTELDIFATSNVDFEDTNLSSFAARFHLSWKYVNLRLGMVFGNYTIGGINAIVPSRIPVPEFDLFLRF